MDMLATRVRPKKHEDLRDENTLWLFGKNNPVDAVNTTRLLKIKGKEFKMVAKCFHGTIKEFKPPIGKTGTIKETPF